MGKAGEALKQTLEGLGITQNELATTLGVGRHIVYRWFHSKVDPTAEAVSGIVDALNRINPSAAKEFVKLYMGDWMFEESAASEIMPSFDLPSSGCPNIRALSRIFSNTSTSYKYVFFISILRILEGKEKVTSPISFKEIFVEMLANAWYPYTYFKLSFGSMDKLPEKLDEISLKLELANQKTVEKDLRLKINAHQDSKEAVAWLRDRYVPFRLLNPFLERELDEREVDKGKGRKLEYAMPGIANESFADRRPLYRFNSDSFIDCDSIIFHPDWAKYLKENCAVLLDWAFWHWLLYMQQRNPNVPNVVSKLRMLPSSRGSMKKQKEYWKIVVENVPISCIYSEIPINISKTPLTLDHYVPWSFVVHNQLWNLVPVVPQVNSSKSNNIPSDRYFDGFVRTQYIGLKFFREHASKKTWKDYAEIYASDLRIDMEDLLNMDKLTAAYKVTIQPLITLASNRGFSTDWIYLGHLD